MSVEDTLPWDEDEGGFSITLKAGKGYEDPWLNMRDSTANGLKRRIIAAFGMDAAEVEDLSLVALIYNATQEFHGHRSVSREFPGSRAMSSRGRGTNTASDEQAGETEQPKAEQEDPNAGPLALIEAATTVDELKHFWVQNNPLTPEVEAAWRAKGKALKGDAA